MKTNPSEPSQQPVFAGRISASDAEQTIRARPVEIQAQKALEHLLSVAERHTGGQAHCVARFLGAMWDDPLHFPFRDIRVVDPPIRYSMLTLLNYMAVGSFDVEDILPKGYDRVRRVLVEFAVL